ncbi:DUF262 domain-containing protein [Moraxella osloensis]|nr:DUF262 domain-containing protein [Moraxella osloensis]MBW4016060.1 DUF262 domain-containing protein [Moraxella osloensis]
MKNNDLSLLNLQDLFESNYVIPIYQRDYTWTEKEINQMLDDIFSVMIRYSPMSRPNNHKIKIELG